MNGGEDFDNILWFCFMGKEECWCCGELCVPVKIM